MTISRTDEILMGIPSGVEVNVNSQDISVKGPKGTLSLVIAVPITAKVEGNEVVVTCANNERESHSSHGLTRTLVANTIEGATREYTKVLKVQGTDYRVTQKGTALELALGFPHPMNVKPLGDITFKIEDSCITVEGISKEQVRGVTANIYKIRPPESYKGKDVRYLGENVRRKVGKVGKRL